MQPDECSATKSLGQCCRIFTKMNFLQHVADIGGNWLHLQLKSEFLKEMEEDDTVNEILGTDRVCLTIVDFMVILRMTCTDTSKCKTFGDLSDALLNIFSMFKHGSHIDVICDRYDVPDSINAS